ncbi:MAG: AAA family ATPase [Saprospirales bacterium]|nr:AAA family ATPase [Saprospirales bacterium]
MKRPFDYITYGASSSSEEVARLLRFMLESTFRGDYREPPVPVCIWGRHGIGKTQVVRDLARNLGAAFAYLAPAQFEEMGDLVGMPQVVADAQGQNVSRFAPPDWAPREEGPGILLIDDVNRADDRILRGLMQLLQNYELVSWRIPAKWHIILTANPDGGDYSVTPMDDAFLTRMLHITLEWNLDAWVRWAERAGIDARGIAFVQAYPELVDGTRTTPRTLVQFFQSIAPISDLTKDLALVRMLAEGCLDPETTAAFLTFARTELEQLISPAEILQANDFQAVAARLRERVVQPVKRLDILSLTSSRLIAHLEKGKGWTPAQLANLEQFLLLDFIPADIRFRLAQSLANSSQPLLRDFVGRPAIGTILLEGLS